MANSFAHDKMAVMWDKVAEETGANLTLTKSLKTYNMSDMANQDKTGNANDTNFSASQNVGDREYIKQKYRFESKAGIKTTDSDFQDAIDRLIPVNRQLSYNIPVSIEAKELSSPSRMNEIADSIKQELAYTIDTTAYQKMINQATQVITDTAAFSWDLGVDAETLMLNRGLSAFDRKLFLSNKHHKAVAKELGNYSREVFTSDAVTRAKVPDLSTFDTMRSDYLLTLAANATTGLTVNGAQSHTVATYDVNGFFLDNRSMSLSITGATTANMPVGTKFTIAGVNAVHPATRQDTGELQTFTVIQAVNGAPVIQPAIVATGPYQNVSAAAGAGAAITILNIATDAPSLFYTPESTVIVPGRVPVVGTGVSSMSATTDQGLPLTLLYWYDGHAMTYNCKAVVSFDIQVVQPEQLGMILAGQQ